MVTRPDAPSFENASTQCLQISQYPYRNPLSRSTATAINIHLCPRYHRHNYTRTYIPQPSPATSGPVPNQQQPRAVELFFPPPPFPPLISASASLVAPGTPRPASLFVVAFSRLTDRHTRYVNRKTTPSVRMMNTIVRARAAGFMMVGERNRCKVCYGVEEISSREPTFFRALREFVRELQRALLGLYLNIMQEKFNR